jgi:hypothetical protein
LITDALKEALANISKGLFGEADRLYREVLERPPNNG